MRGDASPTTPEARPGASIPRTFGKTLSALRGLPVNAMRGVSVLPRYRRNRTAGTALIDDDAPDRFPRVHQIESLVDVVKRHHVVIIGSISIFPCMYQSTIFGTSARPRAPPNAVPRQTRPVT